MNSLHPAPRENPASEDRDAWLHVVREFVAHRASITPEPVMPPVPPEMPPTPTPPESPVPIDDPDPLGDPAPVQDPPAMPIPTPPAHRRRTRKI